MKTNQEYTYRNFASPAYPTRTAKRNKFFKVSLDKAKREVRVSLGRRTYTESLAAFRIIVADCILAVCCLLYAVCSNAAASVRGGHYIGGEILFVTVVPVIAYPAYRTVSDSIRMYRQNGRRPKSRGTK